MAEAGQVRVEQGPAKRIRIQVGGQFVADTTRALYVWEHPYYPTYYLPAEDVRTDLLVATGETDRSPSRGTAELHSVVVDGRELPAAARWYRTSNIDLLAGHIRFDWDAVDAWFEEDEEVYVHARDPYKRIDVLQSSRHVEVVVSGVTVAESHQPRLLFETGLPTRYYLPKTDVRMDLLRPTAHRTRCPYKGTAEYYSVDAGGEPRENLAWWYRHPTAESHAIAGYVCFYNEKVDITVDGEAQDRPETPFG